MPNPTKMNVPTVNFVGEQDGPSERELKQCLTDAFIQLGSVTTAYLARVEHESPTEQHVALCFVIDESAPEPIVAAVTEIFRSMFSSEVQLDIIPLSKEQESRISLVCRAFFTRSLQ
jgi:hypothetical protein